MKEFLIDVLILVAFGATLLFLFHMVSVKIAECAMIELTWSPNSEPDLVGYTLYARATTEPAFKRISTLHKQTSVKVNVDGRRHWILYLTARNAKFESRSSNNVIIRRGY